MVSKLRNTFFFNTLNVLGLRRTDHTLEDPVILKKNNDIRKYDTFIYLKSLHITNYDKSNPVSILLKTFYRFSHHLNMSTRQFFSKNISYFKDISSNFFLPSFIKVRNPSLVLYNDFLNFYKYLNSDISYKNFSVLSIENKYVCSKRLAKNNSLKNIFSEPILQSSLVVFKNNFERNFMSVIFNNTVINKEKR